MHIRHEIMCTCVAHNEPRLVFFVFTFFLISVSFAFWLSGLNNSGNAPFKSDTSVHNSVASSVLPHPFYQCFTTLAEDGHKAEKEYFGLEHQKKHMYIYIYMYIISCSYMESGPLSKHVCELLVGIIFICRIEFVNKTIISNIKQTRPTARSRNRGCMQK